LHVYLHRIATDETERRRAKPLCRKSRLRRPPFHPHQLKRADDLAAPSERPPLGSSASSSLCFSLPPAIPRTSRPASAGAEERSGIPFSVSREMLSRSPSTSPMSRTGDPPHLPLVRLASVHARTYARTHAFLAWMSQILLRVSFHARTLGRALWIQFAGRPKVFLQCGLLRRHSAGIRAALWSREKGEESTLGRVSRWGFTGHWFIRLPIRAPDDERLPARDWSVLGPAFATCDFGHVATLKTTLLSASYLDFILIDCNRSLLIFASSHSCRYPIRERARESQAIK